MKPIFHSISTVRPGMPLTPTQVPAAFQQAVAMHQRGQLPQAQSLYESILKVQPQHHPSMQMLGTIAMQNGRFQAAVDWYSKAIQREARIPEVHAQLGFALQELGRPEAAVEAYDQALALNPRMADTFNNRGVALQRLKRTQEAIASYDQAIALLPGYAEAHYNKGSALLAAKLATAALVCLDRAIALRPDYVKAHVNRGMAWQLAKRPDTALACYDQALALNPYYPEAHFNRGGALQALNRLDDAIASYDRAIALRPDYPDAYLFKSTALLLQGNFAKGWELYEWRWKTEDSLARVRPFAQPMWRGDAPLQGKRILLHGEQGLGDMLQFCRYAPLVAALGGFVILEVPRPLAGVLTGLEGVGQMVLAGDALPKFDFHCPLLSLPLAFHTDLTSIPHASAYLQCQPDVLNDWAQRLGPRTGPRIGIVWSGNPQHASDYNRSMALSQFAQCLPENWQCYSLQKEVRAEDLPFLTAHDHIRHFGDALTDFGDTAALCSLMDVVVSVDTSVAHLSAALGRPTWILLPHVPDWRWLLDREDSPWYPSARLYRQSADADWSAVLARVAADLKEYRLP